MSARMACVLRNNGGESSIREWPDTHHGDRPHAVYGCYGYQQDPLALFDTIDSQIAALSPVNAEDETERSTYRSTSLRGIHSFVRLIKI